MSIDIQYCFNSKLSLPDLASQVSAQLGCSLTPSESEPEQIFCGTLFGMDLHLWLMQDMTNDGDVNFQEYRYLLGNKTWSGSALRQIQAEAIACAAFVLHETLGIHEGMLSCEVQTLLARYEMRDGDWYDLVGGKPVVYPEHFMEIEARRLRSLGD